VKIRILIFLAMTLLLCCSHSLAQSCGSVSGDTAQNCFTFTSANPSFTYTGFNDDSRLTVSFDTVLTTFDLRVTIHTPKPTDSTCSEGCNPIALDPSEFPPGTICVTYDFGNSPGTCEQYDFTGNATGPNGVPVKNKDYKGLISLTLQYFTASSFAVHTPAFGHAPGDIATFTENILTFYSNDGNQGPTMGGKVPGLSSLVALDEPLATTDLTSCFSFKPPVKENNSSNTKPIIEIAFSLLSGTNCGGPAIRDKTATLTVSSFDNVGNVIFPPLMNATEGNKFHWDSKNGLNEYDINTDGLPDGNYTVTVISNRFSPQKTTICVGSTCP
jgi:hypothetical protein